MFFFTEQDPNYRIKGSRDPLGFQPIWQSLGRTVVKYLSTVSNNLKDFQVLSYAWFFYGDRDPKEFLSFFLKFEQACGFARGLYLKDDRFNGIDFVRKNLNNESFSFSTKNEHTLLSNQKSYGIYGKYNRPFTEMQLKEHPDFRDVMETSLREKIDYNQLENNIKRLLTEKVTTFTKAELKIFADCLATISISEKRFYEELILKENNGHVQNEVYKLFNANPELIESRDFNLYSFINILLAKDIPEELEKKLVHVKQAEHVLSPFVFLFRTIQAVPIWTKDTVGEATIFASFPDKLSYTFNHSIIDELNDSFNKSPYEIALTAIKRNSVVSDNRKNAAWVKVEGNTIITCYADGARTINEFEKEVDFEHNYFLPTYISMYKQIMQSND